MDVKHVGVEEAYRLVGREPIVVARPARGLIRLTGEQRIWFLQNTVSADVDVEPGRWVESCFLDRKGHVVAHFRVGVLADELWLDVEGEATSSLLEWFTQYKFRTKVEIDDRSQDGWTLLTPAREGVIVPGPVFESTDRLDGYGDLPDGVRAPEELLETIRIESGIARFGVDYDVRNLPQEAGLTRIVSVTKGCYVGQEVMARLHFRGHVNKCVRPLRFDRTVDAGSPLTRAGAPVGTVTSSAMSPSHGPVGIGMVRVEVEEGELISADGAVATVGPLPPQTKVAS